MVPAVAVVPSVTISTVEVSSVTLVIIAIVIIPGVSILHIVVARIPVKVPLVVVGASVLLLRPVAAQRLGPRAVVLPAGLTLPSVATAVPEEVGDRHPLTIVT